MTADTLFILASCSKAFLSASVGILMDDFAQGRNVTPLPANVKLFDWASKVSDLLPDDWELMDEWTTKKATIRDILSHVSGVPRHDYAPFPTDSPLDVVRNLRNLRPTYELREKWSYNNLMYISGSYLVSRYSGMPYVDFVKERIFTPLNMSSSTYSVSEASQDSKLTQAWTPFGRRIPTWFSDATRDFNAGPGGVISSAVDMTKWLQALLNEGVNKDTNTTVIPRSVFDAVTTSHAIVKGRPSSRYGSISGYGMGWFRDSYKGHEWVYHSGGIPGISTLMVFLPSDDLGIALLANADAKYEVGVKLVRRIVGDALDVDTTSWDIIPPSESPRHSAAQTIHVKNKTKPISLPIEAYAGTYFNPGYGNITLCSASQTSPQCSGVLEDFSPFENMTSDDSKNTLYAAYSAIWSSHARLQHHDGEDFKLTLTNLFPHGYGRDGSPFETWEAGEGDAAVKFILDPIKGKSFVSGFGVMGADEEQEGRKRLVPPYAQSIANIAEVFFVRVPEDKWPV